MKTTAIEAQDIICEIISNKTKKGHMMYRKNFTFEDLIGWVYRNCTGCNKIEINPLVNVIAYFDDRAEIYTMQTVEIPEYTVNDERRN